MSILIGSISFANFSFGYEKENHYWLKMALALNCGFTIDEAKVIATGDWNMDEDSETAPVRPGSDITNPKSKWHALPTENPDVDKNEVSSGNQQIKQRQHELYDRALNEKDTGMRLFKFGQYLHYTEDKWSHWGYTTGIGHAVPNVAPGMTSPDETHANPESYRYMVFDSMVNLGKLAKSLGKDTECVSDLVPLDTYHSAPEYGKDFPWVSPQEIKRSDPDKFKKTVDKHLSDWKKTSLINRVIEASRTRGPDGVTDSFISYVSTKTGISKSDIEKKYDYSYVDIDDNGDAKKLPDSLVKSLVPKDNKKSKSEKTPTESAQLRNNLKELYQISKSNEKITNMIKKSNDNEAKTLKKLSGDAKSIYSKTKNNEIKKLGDKIQEQIKDAEKDKKQIDTLDKDSKKITKQILDIAKDNKISKAVLDKETQNKLNEQRLSLEGMKIADLLEYDGKTLEQHLDEQDRKSRIDMLEAMKQQQNSKNPDAPPESILDDVELSGPDAAAPKNNPKEQKPDSKNQKSKSEQQSDASPESILDDIETSGPDVGAPKENTGKFILKPDWARIAEEDMRITEQAIKQQLLDQIRDIMLQIDLQNQLKDLKQKVVIEDPKKAIIQKEPPKSPTTKTDNKPTQIQPVNNPIETKEKPSNTKPTLSIPKQMTQEATGPAGASVSFSASSQDKEDGSLTPVCNPSSGSTFPIGTTSVSCTVTDSNNNSVSGTFTVTVRDTTGPAIAAFKPTEGVRDDSGVQVFYEVTATDLVDGNVPVSCNYPSGYKFPPGTTNLVCTAADSKGNQSSRTLQITVTVTESGQ